MSHTTVLYSRETCLKLLVTRTKLLSNPFSPFRSADCLGMGLPGSCMSTCHGYELPSFASAQLKFRASALPTKDKPQSAVHRLL